MMKTKQERLKRQIVTIIKRSSYPIRTGCIADQIALPEDVVLDDLLTELMAEGRLIRGYTLLANGNKAYTYNLSFMA